MQAHLIIKIFDGVEIERKIILIIFFLPEYEYDFKH